MLRYELSDNTREKMAANPEAVKAALATIANQVFNNTDPLEGIGKYEGGIRVNKREIAIKTSVVMDDWRRSSEETPEERAVVDAIAHLAMLVEEVGIEDVAQRYGVCTRGDPLRCLLKLNGYS